MAVATRSSSSPSRRYPKERNSVEVGSDSDTLVEHEDQSRTETTVKTTATARSNDVTHQQLSRKGPMRATWHHKPLDEQSFFEKFLSVAGVLQDPPGSERPPVFAKDEPMPYMPIWRQHLWAFPRAVLPLIAHRAFTELTGRTVPPGIAGPLYLGYFFLFGIDVFATLRRMGKKYGFLDGEVPRDGIPDDDVTRVAVGLFNVILFRCIFAFIFVYDQHETISIQWYWPVQLAAYAIILDFWFYWYHRLMHEVPALWRFHRKHHTTKHPNAALGAFADHEQEIGDMLLIPVMTWLVYRIDFPTWWLVQIYTLQIEAGGHSGLRAYFQNPGVFFLRYFGVELCLEDHDLHHRFGYRKSGNYGKQTRLWDWMFGTMRDRIESTPTNIDWNKTIKFC